MRVLLASQSAARRHMLEAAGVPFEAIAAPLDEEADALRDKRLRALGYEIVRFSEDQIRRRPEFVIRTLREKLGLTD